MGWTSISTCHNVFLEQRANDFPTTGDLLRSNSKNTSKNSHTEFFIQTRSLQYRRKIHPSPGFFLLLLKVFITRINSQFKEFLAHTQTLQHSDKNFRKFFGQTQSLQYRWKIPLLYRNLLYSYSNSLDQGNYRTKSKFSGKRFLTLGNYRKNSKFLVQEK